jgi:anti-sigma factor ChrR (cupin superfamily)
MDLATSFKKMFQPNDLSTCKLSGLAVGDTEALPWRGTAVDGVAWLPLASDESVAVEDSSGMAARRGGGAVLIRMAPGRGYPAHRHLGAEDVLVLQGGYVDEWGEHLQGEFVRYPPDSHHAPLATGDGDEPVGPSNPACILFSSIAGGIELLGRSTD